MISDWMDVFNEVYKEAVRGIGIHGDLMFTHQGYGVLREEVDEVVAELDKLTDLKSALWDAIKADDVAGLHKEAVHVAAVAGLHKEAVHVAAVAVRLARLSSPDLARISDHD